MYINISNLHCKRVGHNAIHHALCEGVKLLVGAAHVLWFDSIATLPVVLKHAQIQLHGQVCHASQTHRKDTGMKEDIVLSNIPILLS